MAQAHTIQSLRKAIGKRGSDKATSKQTRFDAVARRYERSVHGLIADIHAVVKEVPDFAVSLEDETEVFTSPAFPGYEIRIRQKRLKIALDDDFVLFDPTARAIASALGQVEVVASRPIRYMMERVLYLVHDPQDPKSVFWSFRSVENLTGRPIRFTKDSLLRLLHEVFA